MKTSIKSICLIALISTILYTGISVCSAEAETPTIHTPIILRDIHASAEYPYIIEGYDITSTDGNCIEIHNSEHIIIRDNYLHDCQIDRDAIDYGIDTTNPENGYDGFAILIGDSTDITIENNQVDYNKQGILVYDSQDVKILENDVRHTIWWRAIALEKCDRVEIAGNSVIDNGIPEWFWAPGNRVLGIWTQQSSYLDIHDNTIIRPTTDGIMVLGIIYNGSMTSDDRDDWTTTSTDIRIYNNTILDVMEIGIAVTRVRNAEIFNNTVRQGGIVLDPDVCDSEVYGNKVLTFKIPGAITLGISHKNYIHDNTYYSIDDSIDSIDVVGYVDELSCQPIKCEWAGIPFLPSTDNVIENNSKVKIGRALKDTIIQKMAIADEENLWEPKGRFTCETEEGVWDEECIAREEAKGNQGIPKAWTIFDPLLDNFDDFAVTEEITEILPPEKKPEPVDIKETIAAVESDVIEDEAESIETVPETENTKTTIDNTDKSTDSELIPIETEIEKHNDSEQIALILSIVLVVGIIATGIVVIIRKRKVS